MHHKMAMDFSLGDAQPEWVTDPLSTGTTILAVAYDGGVVIGADSRTSSGAYIANRVTNKLTSVTDKIYCCRSGSAADTQAISQIVAYHINFYEMELNEAPLVKTAANLFRELCYTYRDQMSASIIVAGWDKRFGGQVFAIPLGGMLAPRKFALGGSGSTYIWGYADSHYKSGMTKEECIEFVKNCISLAINRDGHSGGVIRLAVINENGAERMCFKGSEIPKFFRE